MTEHTITLKPTLRFAILRCAGLLAASITIVIGSFMWELPFLSYALIFMLPVVIYRIIYWRQIIYVITREQMRYSRGVFQRRVDFLEIYRIKDFDQRQSLIMRLIGIMHVRLMTSDLSHPVLELKGVPKSNVLEIIRRWVEQSRKENRVYAVDR